MRTPNRSVTHRLVQSNRISKAVQMWDPDKVLPGYLEEVTRLAMDKLNGGKDGQHRDVDIPPHTEGIDMQ